MDNVVDKRVAGKHDIDNYITARGTVPTPTWLLEPIKKLFPYRRYFARLTRFPPIGWLIDKTLLNGNDLGKLGNVAALPTREEIGEFVSANGEIRAIISDGDQAGRFRKAKEYLSNNEVLSAWKVLLAKP